MPAAIERKIPQLPFSKLENPPAFWSVIFLIVFLYLSWVSDICPGKEAEVESRREIWLRGGEFGA